MSSIPQNHCDENELIDCAQRFFSRHHVSKLLARCNGMKEKGVSPVSLLRYTETAVTIYNAVLPKQKIIHTEWFYADCLADYYHVPVFSEEHWKIMENYIREYVKRGGNMILTPLFTPALDTAIGHERTTTQLLDIEVKSGEYHFGFEKLKRG